MSARAPLADVGPTLSEFLNVSDDAKKLIRNRWVIGAYLGLPNLTAEERRLAMDRKLANEVSIYRVKLREMERDRDSWKRRAEAADLTVDRQAARIGILLDGFEMAHPPESPGASTPGE